MQGAALAGKAAEGLAQTAGLPSRTLASLEYAWTRGRDALDARSVLLIDEAGMIDARQLGRVLDQAQRAGAKVILLGDPDQLPAIGAGDAYRGLLELHPSAPLDTIRRQAEPRPPGHRGRHRLLGRRGQPVRQPVAERADRWRGGANTVLFFRSLMVMLVEEVPWPTRSSTLPTPLTT